jgi:hypothetical protein
VVNFDSDSPSTPPSQAPLACRACKVKPAVGFSSTLDGYYCRPCYEREWMAYWKRVWADRPIPPIASLELK